MVHGFRSNSITLGNEDRSAYDDHLTAYLARYTPIDKVEEDLVGLLASNMWQLMRLNSIEVALFDIEISGIDVDLHGTFETMDEYGRLALAFKKSAGDNALELLRRYKSTTERAYHRALQALEQIDQDRNRKSQQPVPAAPIEEALPEEVAHGAEAAAKNEFTVRTQAPPASANHAADPTTMAHESVSPLRQAPASTSVDDSSAITRLGNRQVASRPLGSK